MKRDIGIIYLSKADVKKTGITMAEIIKTVDESFKLKGQGKVEMPPKPGIHTRKDAFIHAMPAYIPDLDAAGMKWVSGYPDNHLYDLPYISGLIIMNDTSTGIPTVIMDCEWITAKRTGAATAVAAKYLARKDSEIIGIIGCGVQGESNTEALLLVQDNVKKVIAYDIIKDKARKYSEEMSTRYPGIEFAVSDDPKSAVINSDIIVTAGPILKDPEQIIKADWFKEGAFASPVDFDSYWKPEAMKKSDKFCTDDIDQLRYYKKIGYFSDIPEIYGELGQIAAGIKEGRTNDEERIISVNLGIAMEDMAVGKLIYQKAKEMNIGTMLEL